MSRRKADPVERALDAFAALSPEERRIFNGTVRMFGVLTESPAVPTSRRKRTPKTESASGSHLPVTS